MHELNKNRVNELSIIINAPDDRFKDILEFLERDSKREYQQSRFRVWIQLVQFIVGLTMLSLLLLKMPEAIPIAIPTISTLVGGGLAIKKVLEKRAGMNK